MTDPDLSRLVAASALASLAQTEATEARVAAEREAARQAADRAAANVRRQVRLDGIIVTVTQWVLALGAVATIGLGLWAWHDAPSGGQLFLHVWWALVVTVAVIAIIGALAIVGRWPWTDRVTTAAIAVVVIVIGIVALVFSVPRLQYQNVMGQGFNFDDKYYNCGDAVRIPIRTDDGTDPAVWQMFRGRLKDSGASGCNRINLYRNKEAISAFNLPGDDLFLADTGPDGHAAMFADHNGVPLTNSDIVEGPLSAFRFYARTERGRVISISPADPQSWSG